MTGRAVTSIPAAANLGLFFLVELGSFAAVAIGAYRVAAHPFWSWLSALLAVTVVITIWALLFAPRSANRIQPPLRQIGELCVFLGSATLLMVSGLSVPAAILAALALLTMTLSIVWRQDETMPRAPARPPVVGGD